MADRNQCKAVPNRVWCDYGFTLEPSEGIGVFVDNLTRGIIASDPTANVLMVAHPGQTEPLRATIEAAGERVEVTSCQPLSRVAKRLVRHFRRRSYWNEGKFSRQLSRELPAISRIGSNDRIAKALNGSLSHATFGWYPTWVSTIHSLNPTSLSFTTWFPTTFRMS